ncbi:hypothetical protein RRM65_001610 [Aeromonas salmonicida subsp. salmonicida]|nr:hypothetical protein [Aeromonas salmonicida subsp. salmonicida]
MSHFAIGILSFSAAILLPVLYLVARQLRRFGAWVQRNEGPRERTGAMVVILAALGFAGGSFAQPLLEKGQECQAQGQPVVQCMFFPSR